MSVDPDALSLATLDELWAEIKKRHSSSLLVLEHKDYPVSGTSATAVWWHGSHCSALGLSRLASIRVEQSMLDPETDFDTEHES